MSSKLGSELSPFVDSLAKVDSLHYLYRIPSQKSGFPSLDMQDSLEKVDSCILISGRLTNERGSQTIGTIGLPRLVVT